MLQTAPPGALLQYCMHPALLTMHTASQTIQWHSCRYPDGRVRHIRYPAPSAELEQDPVDSLDAVDIALLYEDNWHPDRCGMLLCSSCITHCISYAHSQDWPAAQGRHCLGSGHDNPEEPCSVWTCSCSMCPARWPQQDPTSCQDTCQLTYSVLICSCRITEWVLHCDNTRNAPLLICTCRQLLACLWNTIVYHLA